MDTKIIINFSTQFQIRRWNINHMTQSQATFSQQSLKITCIHWIHTLLKIGFSVLHGPHVGDVYSTHISLGLSWYSFLKAYCKHRPKIKLIVKICSYHGSLWFNFETEKIYFKEGNICITCPLCLVREISKPIATSLSDISFLTSSLTGYWGQRKQVERISLNKWITRQLVKDMKKIAIDWNKNYVLEQQHCQEKIAALTV